ncbi:MAG: 4Fe-4S dicluster domain-containing protein [Clostridia bacterium]|nr:MAG: 4Fe-4S dicluster domain-containing protein [Clostridia bacterium]
MPYVIEDNCIACGICRAACPEEAITDGYRQGNPWEMFKITAACTGCGRCHPVCPTGAITFVP